MVRKYVRKTNRQEWSSSSLQEAVAAVLRKEISLRRASLQFNVPKTTLIRYAKKKQQDNTAAICKSMGKYVCVFSEAQELELVSYLKDMENRLFGLTMQDCRRLAFQLAQKNHLNHPFNKNNEMAGEDWMKNFLSRHPDLSIRKPEATSGARAMGFNRPNVAQFFDLLGDIVDKYKLSADRIYNADETGISVNPKGHSKIIARRGKRQVGALTSAERGENVTAELCFSAAGAYMPPMLIFPRKRVQKEFQEGLPPGSWAEAHETGWINSELFCKWLEKFVTFSKATKDNVVLLILDGHSTHTKNMALIDYARDNGVILLCLPPHASHRLQPLDVALMKPVSNYYEEETRKWLRTHPGKVITLWHVAPLFGAAFINAANMRTAIKGFEKTGIWPVNMDVFTDEDFLPSATTDITIDQPESVAPNPEAPVVTPSLTPVCTDKNSTATSSESQQQQLKNIFPSNTVSNVSMETPLPSSQFPNVSPHNVLAVPQVEMKQKRKTNRKKGKAAILTDSPYKLQLQESICKAKKQKESKEERARKKLLFNASKRKSTTQKKLVKLERKKTIKKEVQTEEEMADSLHSSESEDDTECLYCKECYSNSIEGWIMCRSCLNWAHNSCAGVDNDDDDAILICEFCVQ